MVKAIKGKQVSDSFYDDNLRYITIPTMDARVFLGFFANEQEQTINMVTISKKTLIGLSRKIEPDP